VCILAVHRHGSGKIAGQIEAKFCLDAEFTRPAAQLGFNLRIALQAFGHLRHAAGDLPRALRVSCRGLLRSAPGHCSITSPMEGRPHQNG
jgi:hypothetical protein